MSLRAAVRAARPLRATSFTAPRAVRIGRRYASDGAHAKQGGDTVWMLGSLAGWGAVSAWIFMRFSGSDSHGHGGHHDSHAKHEEHAESEEKAESEADDSADDEGKEGDASEQDVKDSVKQAEKSNVPKAAMKDEEEGNSAKTESDSDDKKEKADDKSEDGGADVSDEDVAASLKRAEQTNVPKIAMDQEAKGQPTPASGDK